MQFPSSEILLMNYGIGVNGQANITPPSSTTHPRTSDSLNTADPIAMHLLVETALGDSKDFEILSFEELEELKRDDALILARIDSTRTKLALETKMRDAAKSLNRLYSSPNTSPKLGRRSISGELKGKRATMDKTEMELATSTRKCEELSRELYHLEQRSRTSQMKLLRHTAGILQLTYRQPKRRKYDVLYPSTGRPESPASLDGYGASFDDYREGDIFQNPDNLDGFLDELRTDKPRKRLSFRTSRDAAAQRKVLVDIGNKLERLNQNVRDVISSTNSGKAVQYAQIPEFAPAGANIDGSINQQLDYLTSGLEDIKIEQGYLQQGMQQLRTMPQSEDHSTELAELQKQNSELQSELQAAAQETLAMQREYDRVEDDMTRQLRSINLEFASILASNSQSDITAPPDEEEGPTDQMDYTQAQVRNLKTLVESLLANAEKSRQRSNSNSEKADQYEVVLQGLWQIILAGEEDSRQRKRAEHDALAQKRSAGEEITSDDELSPDEDDGLSEEFTLPAFSTKVQWLVSKSTYLKEKQGSLRRRIQQHRSALDRSVTPSQDPDVQQLRADYERTSEQFATTREELEELEKQLSRRDEEIRELQIDLESAAQEARDDVRIATAEIQVKLGEAEQRAETLQGELDSASQLREQAQKNLADKDEVLQKSLSELQELESEVVRLTTEVTIAKAELDASYGSRQQRAADWAAAANTEATAKLEEAKRRNAELESEIAALREAQEAAGGMSINASAREEELRRELRGTLAEFEELTRASVEAEKERDALETTVDKLRDQIEALESQLYDEKVRWMGIKSPGVAGGEPSQSMGTTVLKNEFKKMMRDTRAEHLRTLRVSDIFLNFKYRPWTWRKKANGYVCFTGRTRRTTKTRGAIAHAEARTGTGEIRVEQEHDFVRNGMSLTQHG
jgi:Up-regulated During Septation